MGVGCWCWSPAGRRGQAWQAAAGMLAPQIETDYFEPLYELGVAGRERYEVLARGPAGVHGNRHRALARGDCPGGE